MVLEPTAAGRLDVWRGRCWALLLPWGRQWASRVSTTSCRRASTSSGSPATATACRKGKSRGSSSRSWRPTSPGGSLPSSPSWEPPLRSGPPRDQGFLFLTSGRNAALSPVWAHDTALVLAPVSSAVHGGGGLPAGHGAGLHIPPEPPPAGTGQPGHQQLVVAAQPRPPSVAAYRQEVQPARSEERTVSGYRKEKNRGFSPLRAQTTDCF